MNIKLENTVSVIIPTYNRLTQVKRAIESALSQSHKPYEIIVIDDGSNESLKSKLRNFIESKEIIFLEYSHTGNPGYLRKEGIDKASGLWIAFLDDDDLWHPQKLKIQLGIAQSTKIDFVSTYSSSNWKSMNYLEFKNIGVKKVTRRSMLKQNSIVNSSVLVKKSLLLSVDGYATSENTIGVEDYATWLRLLTKSCHVTIRQELTFYDKSETTLHLGKRNSNRYIHLFGILDYINWSMNNSRKKFTVFRILVRLVRFFS